MIATTSTDVVDFWGRRTFGAKTRYIVDGIACWNIDVPEDHPDLKHPDYIGLLVREKMAQPSIIRRRLAPPLFSVKKDGHFALVSQPGFENVVPVSRTKQLLQLGFTNPATGECPDIVQLKPTKKIQRVLHRMQQSGASGVMCVVTSDAAETYDINAAIASLGHD